MQNKILTLKMVHCLNINISTNIKLKNLGPTNKHEVSGVMYQKRNSK
jgi:hypothetical protein